MADEIEHNDNASGMSSTVRYAMSALICLAFAVMGAAEMSRGPTLLDLVAIYRAELTVVSFMAIIFSTGSITGTFFAGMLNNRFPRHGFGIMFLHLLLLAVVTLLIPRVVHVYLMLIVYFLSGYATGAIDVGGNVLCLEMWRGMEGSGPVFHAIHFAYSVGALLAPLISLPFLSSKAESSHTGHSPLAVNATINAAANEDNLEEVEANMKTLYAIYAIGPTVIALGFLAKTVAGFRGGNNDLEVQKENGDSNNNENDEQLPKGLLLRRRLIIALSGVMLATYVGMEVSTATYLPAFGTLSELGLSKKSSANLASIFWAAFALMRFLAIFLSVKFSPLATLTLSFGLAAAGSALSIVLGQTSVISMQVACALLGLGYATVYATCFLWVEDHLEVTHKIATFFVISAGIGNDITGVLMGYTLGDAPATLLYLILVGIIVSVLLFVAMSVLAKPLPSINKDDPKFNDQEHMSAEGLERSATK